MRLISQNKDMDIPYELTALCCERIDHDTCIIAWFGNARYIMARYDSANDASLALEGVKSRHGCDGKYFVFPER